MPTHADRSAAGDPPRQTPPAILETVLSSLNDHIVMLDRDWRYVYVNDRAAEVLQVPREQLVGRRIWDVFPQAVGNLFYEMLHRAMAEQQDVVFDHYYPPFDRWFENRVYVVPEGLSVLSTDVTARKRAEQALRESEARFRAAIEGSPSAFFILRALREAGEIVDFVFEDLNTRGEALIGIPRGRAVGGRLLDLLPANRDLGFFDKYRRVVETGEPIEEEFGQCAAGHVDAWFWQQVVPLGDGIAITTVDATGRKQGEEALRRSEARYRALVEATSQAVWSWDPVTKAGDFSGTQAWWEAITGQTPAEQAEVGWFDAVHPEDRAAAEGGWNATLETGVPYDAEYRVRRREGGWAYVVSRAVSVPGTDGVVRELVGALADVTARKQAEHERELLLHALEAERSRLRTLNETLEARVAERTRDLTRANRALEARNRELQDFAYVASHDLQEPLRKIRAFSGMLGREYVDRLEGEARLLLERMDGAATRMSQLIADLLAFSRVATHTHGFAPVDLRQVAEEVLVDLEVSLAESTGEVVIEELCTVEADPVQMRQLFLNLVGNALKFHRDGVAPVVRLRARLEARSAVPGNGGPESGGTLCRIEVEDNGVGFDEKYVERIFSPFQRLHGRRFAGTGMGLAICRRIVERHGGTITAASVPGQGSRFVVTLPASQQDAWPAGFDPPLQPA